MAPPADIPTDYRERIRRLRGELRLTQSRLGELLGVTTATISRWESGQGYPSGPLWRRLAEAEEHGLYALLRRSTDATAAEPAVPYGEAVVDFAAAPETVRVVTEAHRLTYGHLFHPAFASEVSLVEPLPHQRIAVYDHLLKLPRVRFLLADDPGAGKTIMSGLLLRELLSRRLVRRVLIVPPAGLVGNWKREMRTLFRLPFEIISGADARTQNPFVGEESDLVIVSLDTLAGEKVFARLGAKEVQPYDLVFFDEAHKLSANRNADFSVDKTDRYKLAEALAGIPSEDPKRSWLLPWSCHHLVLLTATPHMGRDYPYYALWRLLDPDVFGSIDAFNAFPRAARKRYFLRRTKEEMVRFDGSRIYPNRISDTIGCRMAREEERLYNETTDYIRASYNKARILNRSAARLAMSVFQRRITSSTWALIRSFERRLQKLAQLIDDIRSGRITEQELEARQRRLGRDLPDPLDSKTADEEEGEENAAIEDRALGGVVATTLVELLSEREQVSGLLALARPIFDQGQESKFEALRQVIEEPRFKNEKLLIFTEHKDTLDFLVGKLGKIGFAGKVAQIHGGMPYGEEANIERLTERQDHVEFFRRPIEQGGATFMVCTDAAAEGINLQFCWLMINYDIPWNPARLEQRMGRIHRFGQKHDPVHIVNLVSDPDKTREGRVLKTLLEKLERIRKELDSDKVFDVIGRLFEGRTLAEYMEQVVLRSKPSDTADAVVAGMSKARVETLVREEHDRFGTAGEVERELPKLKEQMAREERLRLMPGYIRRFIEKATPLLGLGVEGDLDGVFALRAKKPFALDPLLTVMDTYPPEKRNRFSIRKPSDPASAVFFHPGEPVFDKLRAWIAGKFEREALRGAVFIDPDSKVPYSFHLALVTIVRRADSAIPALAHSEALESRLVGLRRHEGGRLESGSLEHLLLLRGGDGLPAGARRFATESAAGLTAVFGHLRNEVGRALVDSHRATLLQSQPERESWVNQGYDHEEADLAAQRTKLRDKAAAGDSHAAEALRRVKQRQTQIHERRQEALAIIRREPELVEISDVELLAHALVLPSADPEEKRLQQEEVERIAMAIARTYEETAGGRVTFVHRPDLSRLAGLGDHPGFDMLSLRPAVGGIEERDIEVKGRSQVGEVELKENEWARAATLRERYWLYVVFDCATDHPRLIIVRDPFKALIATAKGGVIITAAAILAHAAGPSTTETP